MNITLHRLDGTAVVVDTETITATATLTPAQARPLGVQTGTRVSRTVGGVASTVDVIEGKTLIDAATSGAELPSIETVEGPVDTVNAALTAVGGVSVTGLLPGAYMIELTGALSGDAFATNGGQVSIMKNGAAVGPLMFVPVGGFAANTDSKSFALRMRDQAVIATDVWTIGLAAVPGGGAPKAILNDCVLSFQRFVQL